MLLAALLLLAAAAAAAATAAAAAAAAAGAPKPQDFLSELDRSLGRPHEHDQDSLAAPHFQLERQLKPYLQLHRFNSSSYLGNTVTCNDGSPTGYYKRLNSHSRSWIVYLQGGGYCGSHEACQQRWRRSPQLMSSRHWPSSWSAEGILSSEPKENPFLWNANHILVPYCSSDSWSGARTAADQQQPRAFAFMGALILERVFESLLEELPRESSLYEAKFVLLAGDSAGATGAMLNLDKLNSFVQLKFAERRAECLLRAEPQANCAHSRAPVFRGLADSGWFLDNEPYDQAAEQQLGTEPAAMQVQYAQSQDQDQAQAQEQQQQQQLDCEQRRCNPLQSIRQAMLLWNGQVPASCARLWPAEPWRCYFGHRLYPSLRTPLFVVQWLYDEAQLVVDNVARPDTAGQWRYVSRLVADMRASLENVSALFAPSCLSHSLIARRAWNQININGFKLPHILNSWQEEPLANQPSIESLLAASDPGLQAQPQHLVDRQAAGVMLRSAEQAALARPARPARARKRKRNNQQQQQQQHRAQAQTPNRLGRSPLALSSPELAELTGQAVLSNNVPDFLSIIATNTNQQDPSEKFRLIDSCGWPQCNRDCPISEQELNSRSLLSYLT